MTSVFSERSYSHPLAVISGGEVIGEDEVNFVGRSRDYPGMGVNIRRVEGTGDFQDIMGDGIAATARRIDRLVYDLHALTEERSHSWRDSGAAPRRGGNLPPGKHGHSPSLRRKISAAP